MNPEPENTPSWRDDITELIRKKQEENLVLRKVQESLKHMGGSKNSKEKSLAEEENQTDEKKNNQ